VLSRRVSPFVFSYLTLLRLVVLFRSDFSWLLSAGFGYILEEGFSSLEALLLSLMLDLLAAGVCLAAGEEFLDCLDSILLGVALTVAGIVLEMSASGEGAIGTCSEFDAPQPI
jgi:hypothetical protein